jgi:hypothetical protein
MQSYNLTNVTNIFDRNQRYKHVKIKLKTMLQFVILLYVGDVCIAQSGRGDGGRRVCICQFSVAAVCILQWRPRLGNDRAWSAAPCPNSFPSFTLSAPGRESVDPPTPGGDGGRGGRGRSLVACRNTRIFAEWDCRISLLYVTRDTMLDHENKYVPSYDDI